MMIPSGQQEYAGNDEFVGNIPDEAATNAYYLKKRHLLGDLKVEVYDGGPTTNCDAGSNVDARTGSCDTRLPWLLAMSRKTQRSSTSRSLASPGRARRCGTTSPCTRWPA